MICLMHSVQIMRGEVSVKALLGVRRININICYAWRLWAGYRGQIKKPASFLTLQFQAILLHRGTCLQGAFLALPSSCCCSLVSTKINMLPLAKGKRPFSLHYGALQLQNLSIVFLAAYLLQYVYLIKFVITHAHLKDVSAFLWSSWNS